MKPLRIIAAVLALLLLAACAGPVAEPEATEAPATTEAVTTTEQEATTETETTTEEPTTRTPALFTYAPSIPDDLFDFSLIDRLFSMSLADYFREEGRMIEPTGDFEGSSFYYFQKYGQEIGFFFDTHAPGVQGVFEDFNPETALPIAVKTRSLDFFINRQALTLDEMEQWFEANEINYSACDDDNYYVFDYKRYTFYAFISHENNENIFWIDIHCKTNSRLGYHHVSGTPIRFNGN